MKRHLYPVLCLLLVLLTSCAPPHNETQPTSVICRRPPTAVSRMDGPDIGAGWWDLRCADLREWDLSGRGAELFAADFDTRTLWPEDLPEDFDPQHLLELGKDPGLGLRRLHEQGITGAGVGIAIIDQTLLTEHREYGERLRYYQEYHRAAEEAASTHGPAVASIALGEAVGVAPEALLYFIADDLGRGTEEDFLRDMTYYAEDIDRLIALNGTLPERERIRVISMSVGWMPDTAGAEELETAISRAREKGIAVICVNSRDPLLPWMGMGREPYGDPDDPAACRPGAFWEELLYSGEYGGDENTLLVPMDRRTAASPAGEGEYAYFAEGGMSWVVPYAAGLYALACQVKPEITYEEFLAAAHATANPVSIRSEEGREYPCGRAVDLVALLSGLRGSGGTI